MHVFVDVVELSQYFRIIRIFYFKIIFFNVRLIVKILLFILFLYRMRIVRMKYHLNTSDNKIIHTA